MYLAQHTVSVVKEAELAAHLAHKTIKAQNFICKAVAENRFKQHVYLRLKFKTFQVKHQS
jgi:hypothetical protein